MKRSELDALAGRLRHDRRMIVREVGDIGEDLQFIAEDRESELEERAQEGRAGEVLVRLDDRSRREIEEIDAALERVADGTYGACQACGRQIPLGRLEVLPATRFCVGCAYVRETAPAPPGEEAEAGPKPGRVPADLRLLTDRELEQHLREQILSDGRIDMEELRIVCRHGVAYLAGAIPSEGERQILEKLLTDVIGLEDVVDRLQVRELLWEREERSKRAAKTEEPPLGWEPPGTEDIVESTEEGVDYVPPAAPTADEET